MTPDAVTLEEMEVDLARCGPALEQAAEGLRETGHARAAAVLQVLHEGETVPETGARVLAAMEAMDTAERDAAMVGLYNVAKGMIEAGDNRSPGPLVVLLEELAAIYGLPPERE